MDESKPVPIPDLLERVAALADGALATINGWGVRVQETSRLEQASSVLRATAAAGRVEPNSAAVTPVLRALWVAADFADIAAYLPESRVKSIRVELQAALSGELWPDKGSRQPLQLQTQHWIGAMLLHSGLETDHAVYSAKREVKIPEFFVRDGLQRIGVEVKRPESRRRVQTVVAEAMEKFASHRCFGAIVLEITDCIQGSSAGELEAEAVAVMREAHGAVWNDQRGEYRPGFEKLIYLGGVVRGAWEVPAEDSTRLRMMGHALHQGYTNHPRTLQGIVSDRLQGRFDTAFSGVIARLSAAAESPAS